jgi:hypothetical protein
MTPDYIVIGAMKCGTSTLAAQLGAQQGLFMTEPKEPNYFSDDGIFARGADWYGGLFAAAAPGDLKGEASTHYTKRPELPETVTRMKAALPQVRLVYMIRNPMARLVSHYIHDWSQGVLSVPLAEALDSHGPLVDYGRYGWQIAPFVEAYGREAILLTSLERLKSDPGGELARVAAHLGHDGPVAWDDGLEAQNVSAQRIRKFPLHGLLISNPLADALRRALVPEGLRRRIRESRQMQDRPVIPAERVAGLEARFAEDRAALAEVFPGDPTLDLAYPFL